MDDLGYLYFKRRLLDFAGIDLNSYKPEQMDRRLKALMTQVGAKNYAEYARLLQRDQVQLKRFRDYFTINVSEFFRDPPKFAYLRDTVLPELLRRRRSINIWSAGCSYGAEPYTIAMILDQLSPFRQHRILATDIDERILERARAGDDYKDADVRNVPESYRQRYLSQNGESYRVVEKIRKRVEFRRHDLLRDPYEVGFDLIVCRNVVIYFTEEAKDRVYQGFYRSLNPGGILFSGGTEIVPRARELGFRSGPVGFYVKQMTEAEASDETPGHKVLAARHGAG